VNYLSYKNFDLDITNAPGRGARALYKANLLNSPGGEATDEFRLPFASNELKSLLSVLTEPQKNGNAFERVARDFGGGLFEAVFGKRIYGCLRVSLDEAEKNKHGLRIRLRLGDVPELASLPWEYLFYRERQQFFSRSPETPIVRYLTLEERTEPLGLAPPVRVLVVTASPDGYPRLDVRKELATLSASFSNRREKLQVELDVLEGATEQSLRDRLQAKKYNVVHFICHGDYDVNGKDGYVVLEDEKKKGTRLYDRELAEALSGSGGELRLVVLNSCKGARLGATAQSLAQAGIQAVIAMQFDITDRAAIEFSRAFYEALTRDCPVEAAVTEARVAMKGTEWGTPALFMRSQDGWIFSEPRGSALQPLPPGELPYAGMANSIRAGSLIPFLGPSANLCGRTFGEWKLGPHPPSDGELVAHLSAVGQTSGDLSLARLSQYIAVKDRSVLASELDNCFGREFRATALHEFLASIPGILRKGTAKSIRYPLIVTAAYDDALEREFIRLGEPFDLVVYVVEDDQTGRFYHRPHGGELIPIMRGSEYDGVKLDERTVILRLRGGVRYDPDRDSYLITEDDFADHLAQRDLLTLLPANIKEKLKSSKNKFLFVGYGLPDWTLRTPVRRIWSERIPSEQRAGPNSWAVNPDLDPVDSEYWQNRCTTVISDVSLEEYVRRMTRRLSLSEGVG
jgi:hypothetical protein